MYIRESKTVGRDSAADRREGRGGGGGGGGGTFKGFISLYFRLKSACFIASRFMLLTQTSD